MKYNNQQKPSPSSKVMVFVNATRVMLFLVFVLLLALLTYAIPNSLTLQGKLTNLAGVSQQGTFNFSFRIYSIPNFTYYNVTQNITLSNGSIFEANITYINYTDILWEQNQSITTDANGVYDVILTGVNLSFADQYYLGITVAKDNESTPRINLTSAPYSFRANISEDLNANNSYFVTNLSISGNATIGSGGTTLEVSTQTFNLTKDGNINLANNITLSDKITFRFGQIIDNLIGGFLRISGNLNVTGNTSIAQDTIFVDNTSSRVGIGTATPYNTLTVVGSVGISGSLNSSSINTTGGAYFATSSGSVGVGLVNPNYLLQVALGTDGRSVNLSNVVYVNASSGRVGIGTTSPSEALTVIGNVNVSGYLNISGDLTVNKQFNVSSSGNVKIGGGLNVSGNTNISSNLYVVGNAVIGDATSDTIEVNAQISSDLIPNNNDRDLGSGANFWRRGYIDILTVNNLTAGDTNISGTTSPVFTLNSNYSGNDDRDVELVFERGTPTINSVLKWDSTNKRFDMNFPLFIQANNNLTVDSTTLFVDGSINRVGIGTTTPTHTLTVVGDINATGAVFSAAVNITGNLNLLQGSLGVNTSSPAQTLTVQGTLNVTSQPTRSGDLFVASGGNVGVATTSPVDTLTIVGSVSTFGSLNATSINATTLTVTNLNLPASSNYSLWNRSSTNTILRFNDDNVGIGTTIPAARLHVNATTTATADFTNIKSGIVFNGELAMANWYGAYISAPAGTGTITNKYALVTEPNAGFVGINTTNPSSTFQVAGTANITSGSTQFLVNSNGNVIINLKG